MQEPESPTAVDLEFIQPVQLGHEFTSLGWQFVARAVANAGDPAGCMDPSRAIGREADHRALLVLFGCEQCCFVSPLAIAPSPQKNVVISIHPAVKGKPQLAIAANREVRAEIESAVSGH